MHVTQSGYFEAHAQNKQIYRTDSTEQEICWFICRLFDYYQMNQLPLSTADRHSHTLRRQFRPWRSHSAAYQLQGRKMIIKDCYIH